MGGGPSDETMWPASTPGAGGDAGLTGGRGLMGGVVQNFGSNTPAGDSYAQLTRQAWETYVQNFMPYENKLIRFATNRNAPAEAMQRASEIVGQSFEQQTGARDRQLRGLGLTLDQDEQRSVDRSYGMARSLADVTAQNNARDTTVARQQAVLGNPAPALPGI